MNNINFKGGYYIEKTPIKLWRKIQEDLITKGAIIKDFENSRDKFVILDKCFDNEMVTYLAKKHFDFCYYPDMTPSKTNLKSSDGFIKNILTKYSGNAISTRKNLLNVASGIKKKTEHKFKKLYKWVPNDYINKTETFLNIPKDRCHVVTENNVTTFYKKKKGDFLSNYDIESMEKVASASPNDENGVNYLYIYPKTYGEPTKRYALDIDGKIIAEYEHSDFKEFYANFLKNVKLEKKRLKNSR